MSNARPPRSILLSTAAACSLAIFSGCSSEPPGSATSRDGESTGGATDQSGRAEDADEATGAEDLTGDEHDLGRGAREGDAGRGSRLEDAGNGARLGSADAAAADGSRSREDAGGGQGRADGSTGMSDAAAVASCEVLPIRADMRDSYKEMSHAYYQKYASANGVIVATGSEVEDEAVVRYCGLLLEMFSNAEVRSKVVAEKMWFTMISDDEQLSSLPQISKTYGTSLNARARGLGSLTPTICAEDSIMCMRGDPWVGDCICPHETGHTLYSSAIAKVPALSRRLTAITNGTRSSGRLANAYVWKDGNESGMMAWGVQVWYDCAIDGTQGGYHSDINTRAELQRELPEFYDFLSGLLPADRTYDDCYSSP
jgi:hypothetical protein